MLITVTGANEIERVLKDLNSIIDPLADVAVVRAGAIALELASQAYNTGTLSRSIDSSVDKGTDSIHSEIFSHGAIRNGRNYEQYVLVEGSQSMANAAKYTSEVAILASNVDIIVDDHLAVIQSVILG